jgi:hypothetical protein
VAKSGKGLFVFGGQERSHVCVVFSRSNIHSMQGPTSLFNSVTPPKMLEKFEGVTLVQNVIIFVEQGGLKSHLLCIHKPFIAFL